MFSSMLRDQDRLIYFYEIRERAEHAQRAWAEAQAVLAGYGPLPDFWYSMNAFLNSAIAVANIVWPSARSASVKARSAELRAALGIGDNAPRGLRDVRNGFEHFDERIDAWRESSTNHAFIDTNVSPRNFIKVSGVSDSDVARHFDPTTNELGVFGKYMDVQLAVDELSALVSKLPPRY